MIKSSNKPKVFVDADVIFAGAAAPTEHGASHVVLRMGEITLIDCRSRRSYCCQSFFNPVEKNDQKIVQLLHHITKRGKPFVALVSVKVLEFLEKIKAGPAEDGLLGAAGMAPELEEVAEKTMEGCQRRADDFGRKVEI